MWLAYDFIMHNNILPSFLVCPIMIGVLLNFPFLINCIGLSGMNGSFLTYLASIIGNHGFGLNVSQSFKKPASFAISEALRNNSNECVTSDPVGNNIPYLYIPQNVQLNAYFKPCNLIRI